MQKSLWLKHNTTLCYSPVKPSSDIPGMVTLWGAPCQKNKYPGFSCLVTPVILWLQGLFGLIVCEVIQFSKVPFPVIFFSTIATACLPILSRLLWQSIRTLDLIVSLSSWKSFIVLPLCTKSRLLNRHEGSLRSGPWLSVQAHFLWLSYTYPLFSPNRITNGFLIFIPSGWLLCFCTCCSSCLWTSSNHCNSHTHTYYLPL